MISTINVAYNALKDNPNYTLITINNLENTTLQTIDILFIDIQTIQQEQINFTKTALTLWQMGKGFYVLGFVPNYSIPQTNNTELNLFLEHYTYWSFSMAGILNNVTYFNYQANCGGTNENDTENRELFEQLLMQKLYEIHLAVVTSMDPPSGSVYIVPLYIEFMSGFPDDWDYHESPFTMIDLWINYAGWCSGWIEDNLVVTYSFGWKHWKTIPEGAERPPTYLLGYFYEALARAWCLNCPDSPSSPPPWIVYNNVDPWNWENYLVLDVPFVPPPPGNSVTVLHYRGEHRAFYVTTVIIGDRIDRVSSSTYHINDYYYEEHWFSTGPVAPPPSWIYQIY